MKQCGALFQKDSKLFRDSFVCNNKNILNGY